jgi:hypothetical protein
LTPPTTTPEPIRAALAEGWLPGPPPWLSVATLSIDVETALELGCERCGSGDISFRAVHQRRARRYRGFAVCRRCNHATEL